MKTKLDQVTYKKLFEGFVIVDCVVRKKDIVYFLLEQEEEKDDELTIVREIQCVDRPGVSPWGNVDLTGMESSVAGVALLPKEQFIAVSLRGHVYSFGSGEAGFERDLLGWDSKELKAKGAGPEEYLLRGGISKLRTIDGRPWGCGLGRTVVDRIRKDEWNYHTELSKTEVLDNKGFEDIDGFTSSDIYAVGGAGDVWHFDGKKWRQIDFPSNMDLRSVCCAGDGNVYIGAESGSVFKGRGDKWKLIYRGDMTLPFRDIVWHQDTVWCTSDYGLWVIRNDRVVNADVPDGVRVCAGNLSVGDGVLLVAGVYGAALHDGKEWHRIVDYNKLT